ncbi:MFS transporter [Polymorphospora sp. NPDC051019]|uniref:MFS transporter n=1 Tax=Polymorphospora sp. NPDC051019 TaxID=3155725 RepID=UPI00342F2091
MTETMAEPKHDQPKPSRGFGALWGSAVVSSVGDGAYIAAAPLLAAFLTRDPLGVAAVSAAAAAPWFLVSFWSGAIVDRFSRRLVMVVSELVRALGLGLLVVLVLLDMATIPLLAITSFLVVTGQCFSDPAAQAMLPHVVGRDQDRLTRANGRIFAGETVGKSLVGPPIGGLTFSIAPWVPFALDSASFVASAALVAKVPPAPPPPRDTGQSITAAIREGFAYLLRDRLLLVLSLCLAVYNLTYNLAAATLVLFATDALGVTDLGFGLLLAVSAAGAVIAGWVSAPLVRVLTMRGAVVLACICQAAAWLGIAATSSPWFAALGFVALGATSTLVTVAVVSARQQLVPDHLLGRVVSAFRLIGNGIAPIGSLIGGLVAAGAGLRAPMVVAAAVTAGAIAALSVPLFRRL